MSDHSSHFDSVSGTAINLGGGPGSVGSSGGGWNNCGRSDRSSGTNKISSLAKDAKDLGPGLIKDSTMTRPALPSSGMLSIFKKPPWPFTLTSTLSQLEPTLLTPISCEDNKQRKM